MLSSEGGHVPGAQEQNQETYCVLGEWHTPDPLLSEGQEERIDNQLQAKFLLKDLYRLHINTLVMEGTQRETERGFPVGFRSTVLTVWWTPPSYATNQGCGSHGNSTAEV